MGDFVEEQLDLTIPELRYLSKHRLFTRPELHTHTETRRNFEYRLLSPRATPQDYLRYAHYEQTHANTVTSRLKRYRKTSNARKKGTKIVARLRTRPNMVFNRGVHKFPNNIDLWLRYIRYCIAQKSYKATTKLFAKALAYNSTSTVLWKAGIAFHMDILGDNVSARSLAQNGIRSCRGDEKEMYGFYFEVEMGYLGRLRGERVEMGVEVPEGVVFWEGGVPKMVFEERRRIGMELKEMERWLEVCGRVLFVPDQVGNWIVGVCREEFGDEQGKEVDVVEWKYKLETARRKCREVEYLGRRVEKDGVEDEQGSERREELEKELVTRRAAVRETKESITKALIEKLKEDNGGLLARCCEEHELLADLREVLDGELQKELRDAHEKAKNEGKTSFDDVARIESVDEWNMLLSEETSLTDENVEIVRKCISDCCARPLRNREQERIAVMWLEWESRRKDVNGVRNCYEKLLQLSKSAKVAVIGAEAEMKLQGEGYKERARRLFAMAEKEKEARKSVEFWLQWWKFESFEEGDAKLGAHVHWKATSNLDRDDVVRFNEMVQIAKIVKENNN